MTASRNQCIHHCTRSIINKRSNNADIFLLQPSPSPLDVIVVLRRECPATTMHKENAEKEREYENEQILMGYRMVTPTVDEERNKGKSVTQERLYLTMLNI